MTNFFETGRRFVNTWECDENDHMNVQFYFAHFDEAELYLAAQHGLRSGAPHAQHVRFHKELRPADFTTIETALSAHPAGGPALASLMRDAISGDLVATCLSLFDNHAAFGALSSIPCPQQALPRSIAPQPALAQRHDALMHQGYVPTYRAIVHPRDCDAAGNMTSQMHIARATDAAAHFWEHAGLTKNWLDENGFGRVAVEMKLTRLTPFRAGDAILLLSGLTAFTGRTISFRHEFVDVASGRINAVVDLTGLSIDLASRRAVHWPGNLLKHFEQILVTPAT